MTDTKVLPGLKGVIQYGYNAVRGTFAGEEVFELTYAENDIVSFGASGKSADYIIPDGVGVDFGTSSYMSQTTDLLETTSDYDSYFSASVSGEMSYMSYSGSASSSLAFRGSLFQKSSTYYAANFGLYKVYYAQRNKPGALNPAFVAALAALPTECVTSAQRAAYDEFFSVYGTHYFSRGCFGCYFAMQTEMASSFVEESSQLDVSATITAAFDNVTSSGTMTASMAYGSSDTNSTNESHYTCTFFAYGGDSSILYGSDPKKDVFFQSGYENPIMLMNIVPTSMSPTSSSVMQSTVVNLLSDFIPEGAERNARVKAFADALHDYIDASSEGDGILSTPKEKDVNVQYVADRDALIVASVTRDLKTDGDRGILQLFADPESSTSTYPSTLRAEASMHRYEKSDSHIFVTSLTTPVRAGERWYPQWTPKSKQPVVNLGVQALELTNGASLGAWEALPNDSTVVHTAATPGFVVANITCSKNGARGNVRGVQGPDKVLYASASAHLDTTQNAYVSVNSFCMPVPQGGLFQVTFTGVGGATYSAAWIPVLGDAGLLCAPQSDNLTLKQALTDGFLVGTIGAFNDGDRGWLKIYTSDSKDDLEGTSYEDLNPTLATTVHYYEKDHRWIQYNSVCVPVPKGMWYLAACETTAYGEADVGIMRRVTWFPMVETPLDAT